MENKVKTLKTILTIGTVILLIAGISFQFSNIETYIKLIAVGLISFVFFYLSWYEEKNLNFKPGSIVSYIFGNVSIVVAYISAGAQEVFGNWLAPYGDGGLVFIGVLFFLIALLNAISTVKYKIYKLLEVSLWLSVIAISFIVLHFYSNYTLVFTVILLALFIRNIVKMNNYSMWVAIGFSLFAMLFIQDEDILLESLLVSSIVINQVYIIFKNNTIKILPLIITTLSLCAYNWCSSLTIPGLCVLSIIDFAIAYFKKIDTPTKGVFYKLIVNFGYVLLICTANYTETLKYLIPCIILLTSLSNIYIAKDEREEYIVPFKAFYFTFIEMNNLPIKELKVYLMVFATNIVNLLLYFLAKKKGVRYCNLGLIVLINIFALLFIEKEVIASIVYLILFYLDFYIIYVKEEKGESPLSIAFIVYGVLTLTRVLDNTLESSYFIVAIIIYGIYLAITKKNKIIFSTTLVMFMINIIKYVSMVIENATIVGLIVELVVTLGLALFQKVVLTKNSDKVILIGVLAGLQIFGTAIMPVNVLLKVYVLVEAIGLMVLSMTNNEFAPLNTEGIIGIIVTLLAIIGSFDNLPKSLYLIIVGLVIVLSVPIFIKKYLKKLEEEKKLEVSKPKAEPIKKEEVKNDNKIEYHRNFCPNCGTKVIDQYSYCNQCGNKLK